MRKTLTYAMLSSAFALSTLSAFAADYVLKIQSSDPAGDQNFLVQKEWAEKLLEDSEGKLEIELLPVGSIVKHTETLDSIKMGVIDRTLRALWC